MGDVRATRVTGADRDTLATGFKSKYEAGASIRELSAESGKSYGFVHRLLGEAGVQLRGRGGATRGPSGSS